MREGGEQQRGERRGDAAGDDHQVGPAEAVGEKPAEGHRENRHPDRQAHDEPGVAERGAARHQHPRAEGNDGDEARVEASPAKPALTASLTSRRGSVARRSAGPDAPPGARGGSRYTKAISTSPRAAASPVATIAIRHDE